MKLIKAVARAGVFTLSGIRLASILEKSEEEIENTGMELKSSRTFKLLRTAGVIRSSGFKGIRFSNKNMEDCRLKSSSGLDFSNLLNGKSKFISRMKSIGQKNFKEYFLKGETSDIEISKKCGLTLEEVKKMKEFVNDFFIYSDINSQSTGQNFAPVMVYSLVAGVDIKRGRPEISFFNREIWKEKFSVDKEKLAKYLKIIPNGKSKETREVLERLDSIESRKSTLYCLLELLVKEQKEYLINGNPESRNPLTQKAVAAILGVHPSVINRIISNKSIQMPWGVEIPIAELLPSEKNINRERLCVLIDYYPQSPDRELKEKMYQMYGVELSRRSIAQYRKELSDKNRK